MAVDHSSNVDLQNRPLHDLRISVTDRCNFRCSYCMPSEIFGPDYAFLEKSKLLTFEEMTRLVGIFQNIGVKKIRITGGEPLLRKDLDVFINMIHSIAGIEDIALTTNGSLLKTNAEKLKLQHLKRVTVSLDSLDDERFGLINGVGYAVNPILEGIEEAHRVGLPVKINMVVKKGVNEKDILPMARYFKNKGHTLRFIEFMDVGNSNGWKLDQVLPSKEIVKLIHGEMPLEPIDPNYYGEVANRYKYQDSDVEIGLISSVTHPFCSTCTRARLSAEGKLYTCLFASEGHDLRTPIRNGATDNEIEALIRNLWTKRDDKYSEIRLNHTPELTRRKKKVEMSHIGG